MTSLAKQQFFECLNYLFSEQKLITFSSWCHFVIRVCFYTQEFDLVLCFNNNGSFSSMKLEAATITVLQGNMTNICWELWYTVERGVNSGKNIKSLSATGSCFSASLLICIEVMSAQLPLVTLGAGGAQLPQRW